MICTRARWSPLMFTYVLIGAHANAFFFFRKKGSTLWCYLDLVASYGGGYGALNIDEYLERFSLYVSSVTYRQLCSVFFWKFGYSFNREMFKV